MKKMFWGAIAVLVMVSLFFGSLSALAAGNDNLTKAGQQALQEREEALIVKRAEIDSYIQQISADGVVTKNEMVALWGKVDDFSRAKEEADSRLMIYGLETLTDLDKELQEVIYIYANDHTLIKRGNVDRFRIFFASRSGQDVIIKGGIVLKGTELTLIAIALLGTLLIILWIKGKAQEGWAVLGFFILVAMLVGLLA